VGRAAATEPLLQEGPQCGLVALAMALAVRGAPRPVPEVLQEARARGLTLRGEMFSAEGLAQLAEALEPGCGAAVLPVDRLADTACLVDSLLAGGLLLVPYDCLADHSPGLADGGRAHWALVTGFLLPVTAPPPGSAPMPGCPRFHLLPPGAAPGLAGTALPAEEPWLVCRQGKAAAPGLWPRAALLASCGQLRRAAASRRDGTFLLPQGGLGQALAGRVVFLPGNTRT
jgi:hypothetical protein